MSFILKESCCKENLRHFCHRLFKIFLLNLMYQYAKNTHYTGITLDALTPAQNHAGIML